MTQRIKASQAVLKAAGLYGGPIDGLFGPNSRGAAHRFYDFPADWKAERLATGVIQVACIANGISAGVVDGLWGRKTQGGFDELTTRMDLGYRAPEVDQDVQVKSTGARWPRQSTESMNAFYGPRGSNTVMLDIPFTMVLAWDTDVRIDRVTVHRKVAEPLRRIWTNVLDHYGLETLRELNLHYFGGCKNVRRIRGGRGWSTHSWSCAWDVDPDRNRLNWGRDRAFLARPEYRPFWKFVEAEGAVSLGRDRNFDWQHFQFARL